MTEHTVEFEVTSPLVPEHMRGAIERYLNHGIEPGGFMMAVLCNDLVGALGRADHINRERIHDIVEYLYNNAPAACWGSPGKVSAWIEARRAAIAAATEGQQS